MADGETSDETATSLIQQVRLLARTEVADNQTAPGWREDLRLFAFTWAAGFVFFLIFLA